MRTINDVVVEKLNRYMGEQNLTQYRLAQKSGIPFYTIKSIMQKKTKSIDLKTVILLSAGLGIKPCQFLDDDNFLANNLNI